VAPPAPELGSGRDSGPHPRQRRTRAESEDAPDKVRGLVAGDLRRLAAVLTEVGAAPSREAAVAALGRGAIALLGGVRGAVRLYGIGESDANLAFWVDSGGRLERAGYATPPPESIAGQLLAGGPAIIIEDLLALDPTASPLYAQLRQLGLRSSVAVPIIAGGRRIGSLHVDHKQPGFFGPADLAIAELLATQAGAAVERTRQAARGRREDELQRLVAEAREQADTHVALIAALRDAAGERDRALSELALQNAVALEASAAGDLQRILDAAFRHLTSLMPCTGGSIAIIEDDSLVIRAAIGPNSAQALGMSLPRGRGRSWTIVDTGQSYVCNDIVAADLKAGGGIQSFLAAPLRWQGEAIGLLEVDALKTGAFAPRDVDVAERISLAVSGAVALVRRYEAERTARQQAEAAVRIRDDFLSIAAHELKTPVTSIRGATQLAQRRIARQGTLAPAALQQLLLLLDSQSARLSRLVEHVLDLTWDTPAGHPLTAVPTDLAALVREAVRSVSLDPARHPVDLQLPSQPLMAQVDADRMVQVVIDLLDNAARFSPEGGRIEVTLVRDGHSAALAVRDHGAGIPAEQLPHVFERFYQGHADTHLSGLGLGLFVARRVVEAHGGTIALIPATGGGTRVVVTLPSLAT